MPGLWCHTIELIPFFPEWVGVPFDFLPRQLDVPDGFIIMMLRSDGNTVVIRSDIRVGRHNRIRQVWRCFRTFSMRNEVFSVFNTFRLNTVVFITTGTSPLWLGFVGFFPEWLAWIGSTHHHPTFF